MDYSNLEDAPNRGKAIRLKCLDCCCGHIAMVKTCYITTCPLWPWRMGPGGPAGFDGKKAKVKKCSKTSKNTTTT